jgi:hypothetical protein
MRFDINVLCDGMYGKLEMIQSQASDLLSALVWSSARHFQIYSIETEVVRVRPSSVLAWSGLRLLRVVQGMDLEQRPLAFDQVLKFIRTIRSTSRRPVKFIGISQTCVTADMVRQIARAIAFLPMNTTTDSATILEMQKVVARALRFTSPRLH